MMIASLVAITRIMDSRHHAFDVLFGSMLGMLIAWISYRQYFPAIRNGGVAYRPREFGHSAPRVSDHTRLIEGDGGQKVSK